MKQIFKHYVVICGKSIKEIAEEINSSGRWIGSKPVIEQLLHNWVRRSTPVYVDFDHRNYEIKRITNEKVLMANKS